MLQSSGSMMQGLLWQRAVSRSRAKAVHQMRRRRGRLRVAYKGWEGGGVRGGGSSAGRGG